MGFSDLKWVYGPTHRARDVPNDAVDAYKRIIQQLYLDQDKTREEVLGHLQDSHGFWLSLNQFSKAIKRWGFYKQPRQVQRRIQPPESITEEEEANYPLNPLNSPNSLNPLNPLEELFDFEPDALDTIDETEVGFQTGRECATDPQNQEQLSYSGKRFVSEAPPSSNHSEPQAVSDDFPCDALPCDTERSLHEISQRHLQQMKTTQKFKTRPLCLSSEILAQASLDNHTNKSHVDYLTCCYLFEEAVECLERPNKPLDKKEHRVPRSNTDKLFAPYRRDKDKLLARPNISLDMWSILRLLEQNGERDDLIDRLDTNDLRFMNAMRECLGLCKKWIGLVGKGLPSRALQFDSLFLHKKVSKAVQNICRPLHEQGRYDIWKEAGYLFAFIWCNEKLNAANLLCWLEEGEISGLSPTHFLAIICEMIVHITALSSPYFGKISSKGDDGGKFICGLYLQIIEEIKRIKPARTIKKLFINYFFNRHAGLDLSPEEKRDIESVQSYQRTAENFVFKEERDTVTKKVSEDIPLHGDVRITNFGSLASSRSTNSPSYSSRYLNHRQDLTLLSSNPTMTRSLASGSSRGSSLNSFRAFQAASRAMEICLKEDQDEHTSSIKD